MSPIIRDLARRFTSLNAWAVAIFCLTIGGCISVPLSTIVRMSTFDEKDFVAIDPTAIRTRIKLPDGFILDAGRSSLAVKITSDAGDHFGDFKLEQVSVEGVQLSLGFMAGDVAGTAYTLRLSDASKTEFRKLQAFVSRGRPGQVVIGLSPILSAYPAQASSVNVWVDLLLNDVQGYFTLLDAAEVPMDVIREASKKAKSQG